MSFVWHGILRCSEFHISHPTLKYSTRQSNIPHPSILAALLKSSVYGSDLIVTQVHGDLGNALLSHIPAQCPD